MEPYNKNLPFVRLANDGKSLLDRMVEAGIPLTRALQYFRDNPEGSALETVKLVAEDVVPFYGNYRNGGDISDYAKEAALMFSPTLVKAYRKSSTFKPDPQRKYYASTAEPMSEHKLFTPDPNYSHRLESIPEVGDGGGRLNVGLSDKYYEVDPVKYIQDQQQLAQMSIDAAKLVPTRYESVGDVQLSNKRHYTYGELIEKQRSLKEQIDKFNWKRGWKRDFNRDPLTPDEQKKMSKLQNLLTEVDIELGLSDYKAVIDNTYGPYYDDLKPQYPWSERDYDNSFSYALSRDRKDIGNIK